MGLSVPWEAVIQRTEMVACSKCICDTWFCVWVPSLPKIHVTFPSLSAPRRVSPWVSLKSEQSHYSSFTIFWDWHRFEHHHGMGLWKQRGGEWHHKSDSQKGSVVLWDITHTVPPLGQRGTQYEKRPSCTETFTSNCRASHSTSLFFPTDLNHSAHFRW